MFPGLFPGTYFNTKRREPCRRRDLFFIYRTLRLYLPSRAGRNQFFSSCAHHPRDLPSYSLRVCPVASEMRQGVFSELESQTFKRDCTQRSTGLSSQAATAKLQSTTKIGRVAARWMMGNSMGLIVPFTFGLGI